MGNELISVFGKEGGGLESRIPGLLLIVAGSTLRPAFRGVRLYVPLQTCIQISAVRQQVDEFLKSA
jgi:hypothetical protein